MFIDPAAHGSPTCRFALRNLHKSPGGRIVARCACCGHAARSRTSPRRLVQVSCGWPRVGRAPDQRTPAGTQPLNRPRHGAHFRDFCTAAASRGGPGTSFLDFCTAVARDPGVPRPAAATLARGAGGHLGTTRASDLRKHAAPPHEAGAGSLPRPPPAGAWPRRISARSVQKSKKDAPHPPPSCHRGTKVRKKCTPRLGRGVNRRSASAGRLARRSAPAPARPATPVGSARESGTPGAHRGMC